MRRCSVPGCERPHQARGFCQMHYRRVLRYGDPLVVQAHGGDLNRAKTHCKRGHSLSGDNVRVNTNGRRVCRACQRARDRQYRAERKAWLS